MVEIRGAEPDDAADLAMLDVLTWSPLSTPAPPRNAETPFFREQTEPTDVLVAVESGQLVGYVTVQQTIRLPSHAHVLQVNGLAVHPEHQGRGIGRLLVEAAKRDALRRGARKLSLRVFAPNTAARRLYESSGFAEEGVLHEEFLVDGQLVDDILMACRLDREPDAR